jgi:plasmid stabilization system protein ParE
MGYKVTHTLPAEKDLDRIVHYVAIILENPKAAKDLRSIFNEKKINLRENPRIYPVSRNEEISHTGLRSFLFGNYIAFFKIYDEIKTVTIVRIVNQRQDYENML